VFRSLPNDSRWRAMIGPNSGFGSREGRRRRLLEKSLSDEQLRCDGRDDVEEILIPGPEGSPPISTLILRPTEHLGVRTCLLSPRQRHGDAGESERCSVSKN
jgi:hypothetical protein